MNICKKIISTICASVFAFSCFGFNADAKVIEPEIVKTETWTTSYFIDDDMDTLYPYIQCEADIYNDGTIKLYMWNTHEWDGFATVKHSVTIIQSIPIEKSAFNDIHDNFISFEYNTDGRDNPRGNNTIPENFNSSVWSNIDISYYDDFYSIDEKSDFYRGIWTRFYQLYDSGSGFSNRHPYYAIISVNTETSSYGEYALYRPYYECFLPSLQFSQDRQESYKQITFKPTVEPTGTYNFRLFGHDITITPELLSGNIVAEPELTEQEKYIKQLEEENSKLKTEIESYKKLDFDGDGLLTNADAQMILVYYTDSLVGKTTGKVEDYSKYVKQISG